MMAGRKNNEEEITSTVGVDAGETVGGTVSFSLSAVSVVVSSPFLLSASISVIAA